MQLRCVFAVAVLLGPTAATAASYDAVKQFSAHANTSQSTWSYRFGDGHGHDGNYMLLTDKGALAVTRNGRAITLKDWDDSAASFTVPLFAVNKPGSAVTLTSNGQPITIAGRTMIYHPGYGFPAILSFLAPAAGIATIRYDVTALDWSCGAGSAGITWAIEKNSGNGALASGSLVSVSATSIQTTGPQSVSVSVAAGDRINFIVDGVANPPNCDSTGLQAVISLR